MKFTEEKLEKAISELLGQEGFRHHLCVMKNCKPADLSQ
jgi:hypothetical protein